MSGENKLYWAHPVEQKGTFGQGSRVYKDKGAAEEFADSMSKVMGSEWRVKSK